jgi:MFS family permease
MSKDAGRVLQAGGTAVMLPLLTTTVMSSVPAARRGRTVGMNSVVIAVAPAVGPAISGMVLDRGRPTTVNIAELLVCEVLGASVSRASSRH